MSEKNTTIAIVPGSFDPITYGHLDLVERAAKQFDKVYVAVMINREKHYMFTLNQRQKIAEEAVRGIENVEVISSEGMLWKLAKDLGACAIVKGYRNEVDLAYEKKWQNLIVNTILMQKQFCLNQNPIFFLSVQRL